MLSRRKNNMFMSFRHDYQNNQNNQNLYQEIQLNVQRGLNRLNSMKDTEINTKPMQRQLSGLAITDMTSIDFAKDIRSQYRIHENRMRDVIYTKKFWKAICCNSHLFKDKIVLDVSCDVGVLSMFCVIAGAKHVYAVDTSNIVQLTRNVIADNNLSHKITVIKGKVADIKLPVDKVDIIVSTFFGQSLFCSNRLDEVIDARDKWLQPNGLIFPDRCNYYIAGLDNQNIIDRSLFWQNIYYFDMRPMVKAVNSEPYLCNVKFGQVLTNTCRIKRINLYNAKKRDYRRFEAPFSLFCETFANIGALCTFFDVEFNEGVLPIKFTNQPGWLRTCWRPLIFFLSRSDFVVDKDEVFYGVFCMNAVNDDYTNIDWRIEINHQGTHCRLKNEWHFKTR